MPCEKCNQSYLDSYDVAVDAIARAQPDLAAHELRVKAAAQFRPTFRAMRLAEQTEKTGGEQYENGEFLMIDGKIFFPSTGQFASELHENQRQISRLRGDPSLYSTTDHQTTQLVEKALASGATLVTTAYARDGNDNRDILEYIFNPDTCKGKIVVHNQATDGKLHSFVAIREKAGEMFFGLNKLQVSEKVFVLTDVNLPTATVRQAVEISIRPPEGRKIQARVANISHLPSESPTNGKQILPMSKRRESSVVQPISHRVRESVKISIKSDRKDLPVSKVPDQAKVSVNRAKIFDHQSHRPEIKAKISPPVFDRQSKMQRADVQVLDVVPEKTNYIVRGVTNLHRKISIALKSLTENTKTPAKSGLTPVFLESFRRKPVPELTAVEKSIARKRRRERKILRLGLRRRQQKITANIESAQPELRRKVEVSPVVPSRKAGKLDVKQEAERPQPAKRRRRRFVRKMSAGKKAALLGKTERYPVGFLGETRENKRPKPQAVIIEAARSKAEKSRKRRRKNPRVYLSKAVGLEPKNRLKHAGLELAVNLIRKKHLVTAVSEKTPPVKFKQKAETATKLPRQKRIEVGLYRILQKLKKRKEKIQVGQDRQTIVIRHKNNPESAVGAVKQQPVEKTWERSNFLRLQNFENRKKREIVENILSFSYFWTFFILLNLREEKRIVCDYQVESSINPPAKLPEQEPTPWVLLAIIWHMAMIREQGMLQGNVNSKQKGKKQIKKRSDKEFPQQGIIFAFGS